MNLLLEENVSKEISKSTANILSACYRLSSLAVFQLQLQLSRLAKRTDESARRETERRLQAAADGTSRYRLFNIQPRSRDRKRYLPFVKRNDSRVAGKEKTYNTQEKNFLSAG